MPIRPYLDGHKFDPETIRAMGLAYEMARVALRLSDCGDLANEVLAHKIINIAQTGERNPERLCDVVLREFGMGTADDGHQPGPGREASCCRRRH